MTINLNPDERKVLRVLATASDAYDGWPGYFNFAGLCRRTRLNRRKVRLACRSLKRKGLADFCRGLWSEDGGPGGSGYGATREGAEFIKDAP